MAWVTRGAYAGHPTALSTSSQDLSSKGASDPPPTSESSGDLGSPGGGSSNSISLCGWSRLTVICSQTSGLRSQTVP